MGDPSYSLYCKQWALETEWSEIHGADGTRPGPWACGFASLITCFRLLGDRTTEDRVIVGRFRRFGGNPLHGMDDDDAGRLAREFGYRATRNPAGTRRDWGTFSDWLDRRMGAMMPVMLLVDSSCQERESDHWWVVYGDPESSNLWVMDPLEPETPFECLSRADIRRWASCDDGEGFLQYIGLAISAPRSMGMIPAPPSATLMRFVNGRVTYATGWMSEAIASALVENHFSTLSGIGSRGRAGGAGAVALVDLLARGGAVDEIIDLWGTFFRDAQRENMDALRAVLSDIEAHHDHRIAVSEADHVTHEIALNLILIGTNLMDG